MAAETRADGGASELFTISRSATIDSAMALTKKQIAQSVNQGTGVPFGQAYQLVYTTLETIKSTLASGEDVLISGFGKFKVNEKSARKRDMQAKVMLTMFSLFAEIERDLISERTKEGLARARAQGKILGRPKGKLGKSRLDGKEAEIKVLLGKGVTKANIAKIYECSWPTIQNFIRTRRLA